MRDDDRHALLTLAQAAALAGLSTGALRHHVRRGRLPVIRWGRAWRVRREDIDAFLTPSYLDGPTG